MDKMRIEQQNGKNYLVGIIESTEQIDEDCLAAASAEESSNGQLGIPGVIPIICSQMFQEKILRYDINTFTPVAEYKKEITNRSQLAELFLSIINTYEQTEAYLLDVSYFLLEEQYIFVDDKGKAHLVLYPVLSNNTEANFRELFTQLMRGIHLIDADMDFYGKIIYELTYTESFNLVKFKDILQERVNKNVNVPTQNPFLQAYQEPIAPKPIKENEFIQKPVGTVSREETERKPMKEEEPPIIAMKNGEKKSLGGLFKDAFGTGNKKEKKEKEKKEKYEKNDKKEKAEKKTVKKSKGIALPDEEEIPEAYREKVVLQKTAVQKERESLRATHFSNMQMHSAIPMTSDDDLPEYGSTDDELEGMKYLTLFYENEKKQIPVQRLPFEIGREGNGFRVDQSKTKVSRKHVVISMSAEGFSICDTSKLGTYMNGSKLPKDVFVPLYTGAVLDLKGEIFRVNIQ